MGDSAQDLSAQLYDTPGGSSAPDRRPPTYPNESNHAAHRVPPRSGRAHRERLHGRGHDRCLELLHGLDRANEYFKGRLLQVPHGLCRLLPNVLLHRLSQADDGHPEDNVQEHGVRLLHDMWGGFQLVCQRGTAQRSPLHGAGGGSRGPCGRLQRLVLRAAPG